jgi:hypothetical protein
MAGGVAAIQVDLGAWQTLGRPAGMARGQIRGRVQPNRGGLPSPSAGSVRRHERESGRGEIELGLTSTNVLTYDDFFVMF